MITRRDFIKGMGALALIPFIPEMMKPEPDYLTASEVLKKREEAHRYVRIYYETTTPEKGITAYMQGSEDGIKWDNTGTMTIPHVEDGERTDYKVRYTVTKDGTEAEIVGEE